jgi:SAM-dependent methyltransferase
LNEQPPNKTMKTVVG